MTKEREHKITYPCELVKQLVHSVYTIAHQDDGIRTLKEITCDGLDRCGIKNIPTVPEGIEWSPCPLYGDLAKMLTFGK